MTRLSTVVLLLPKNVRRRVSVPSIYYITMTWLSPVLFLIQNVRRLGLVQSLFLFLWTSRLGLVQSLSLRRGLAPVFSGHQMCLSTILMIIFWLIIGRLELSIRNRRKRRSVVGRLRFTHHLPRGTTRPRARGEHEGIRRVLGRGGGEEDAGRFASRLQIHAH